MPLHDLGLPNVRDFGVLHVPAKPVNTQTCTILIRRDKHYLARVVFDFQCSPMLSCAQPRSVVFLFVDGCRHRVLIVTPSSIDKIVLLYLESIEDRATDFCSKIQCDSRLVVLW